MCARECSGIGGDRTDREDHFPTDRERESEGRKGRARRIVKKCFYFPVTMQRQRLLPDAMTAVVRAAVLAAVLGQLLGPSAASRPAGAHPGHAYFEQPCCGRSHLRHHKG